MTAVARTTAFVGEEDLDVEALEQAPESAAAAQGIEEQDAHRRRRQHQGQRQDGFRDRAQRPAAAGKSPGRRDAQRQDQGRRDRGDPDA